MNAILVALAFSAPAPEIAAYRFRPEALPVGGRAVIVGTYAESIDREIRIEGLSARLRVEGAQARAALELKPDRDNVRVEVERAADGGLHVISIGPGPADPRLFSEELARIDPSDEEGLLHLGALIRRREEKGSPGLEEIRGRVVERVIALAAAEKDDRRLEILSRLATEIGDEASLRALARFASEHPTHAAAGGILERNGYVRVKGAWRSLAEHRQAQGYVLEGREWIPRRESLFRRQISDLSRATDDPLIPRLTKEIYQRHAKKGHVVAGMNRAEIVLAWGWPEAVHRRAIDGVTYEQWVYPDRYVYLRGGLAAATERSDGAPLPSPPSP